MNAQIVSLTEQETAHDDLDKPGRRLRLARQAKGLELERVAQMLHLTPPTVAAIEADNYDALPGPVFVRGYIRNYARLLNLDEESFLRDLSGTQPVEPASAPRVRSQPRKEIRSSHAGVRLVSWLIVLSVAGLLYLWWQNPVDLSGVIGLATTGSSIEPKKAGTPELTAEGKLSIPLPAAAPGAMPAAPKVGAPVETRSAALPAPASPPSGDTKTPATAEPTAPAQPASTTEPVQGPEVAEGSEAPAAVPAEPVVVFEFTGTCWVDVRDSSRQYKLLGDMHKGDRHELGGTPPYSVILGNALAVKVTVNGEPFDVASRARGNVARFTLDPAGVD